MTRSKCHARGPFVLITVFDSTGSSDQKLPSPVSEMGMGFFSLDLFLHSCLLLAATGIFIQCYVENVGIDRTPTC